MLSDPYFDKIVKPADEDLFKQKFVVSLRCDYRTIVQLDLIGDRYCWTRAQTVRYLLQVALSNVDMRRVDCLGLWSEDSK